MINYFNNMKCPWKALCTHQSKPPLTTMAAPAKSTPKDAQVMMAILKDMGVTEYEPRVVNQMLEFTYRYVTDVLDDAKSYSSHANKKNIDMDDVKLALQSKLDHSFTTPPPRDLLMDISRHKNNTALPVIRPYTGLKLPPDRYCLSNTNYRLRSLKKPKLQMVPGTPVGSSIVTQRVGIPGTTVVRPGMSNLGAGSLTVVTRGVSQPTFTYRPATTPVNPQVIRVAGSGSTTPSSISVSNSLINSADSVTLKRKREDDDDYDV